MEYRFLSCTNNKNVFIYSIHVQRHFNNLDISSKISRNLEYQIQNSSSQLGLLIHVPPLFQGLIPFSWFSSRVCSSLEGRCNLFPTIVVLDKSHWIRHRRTRHVYSASRSFLVSSCTESPWPLIQSMPSLYTPIKNPCLNCFSLNLSTNIPDGWKDGLTDRLTNEWQQAIKEAHFIFELGWAK